MKSLSQHITESFSETNESILNNVIGNTQQSTYTKNERDKSDEMNEDDTIKNENPSED